LGGDFQLVAAPELDPLRVAAARTDAHPPTDLAAARVISREPVIYVRSILKYYVTYRLFEERRAAQAE
jgi:hypothetical protein